jgi:hypothetical protein
MTTFITTKQNVRVICSKKLYTSAGRSYQALKALLRTGTSTTITGLNQAFHIFDA